MFRLFVITINRTRKSRFAIVCGFLVRVFSPTYGVIKAGLPAYEFVASRFNRIKPDGHGPVYSPATLGGRAIDGCLLNQAMAHDPILCNGPAQMEIATEFCLAGGYKGARTFSTRDTLQWLHSYKMSSIVNGEGTRVHVWNEDDRGGFIFTMIECRN